MTKEQLDNIYIGERYYIECIHNMGCTIEITSIEHCAWNGVGERDIIIHGFNRQAKVHMQFYTREVTFIEAYFIDCDLGI